MKVRKDLRSILTVMFMAVAALVLVPVRANASDSGTFSVYGEYTCSYSTELSVYGSTLTISSTAENAEANSTLVAAMKNAGIYGGSGMIIFDFPNSTRDIGNRYEGGGNFGLSDYNRITVRQKSAENIYVPVSNNEFKAMTVTLADAGTVKMVNDTYTDQIQDVATYPEINLNVSNMTKLNIGPLDALKMTVTESGYPDSCSIDATSMLDDNNIPRVRSFEYTHNHAVNLSKSGINTSGTGNTFTADYSSLINNRKWRLDITPEYKDIGITVYVPNQAAAGNMEYKNVSLTKKANHKYSSIDISSVFANSNLAPNYTAGALYYMSGSLGYGSAVNTSDYIKESTPLILAVNNAQNVTVTKKLYGSVTQTEAKPLTSSITALQIPSRTGYTFTGWSHTKDSGTTAVTYNSGTWSGDSYVMKGTNVCTAQWRANAYQVTMNGNGGQIFEGNAYDSGEGADTKTISQTFDAVHGCLSYIPYRKGYTFKGWAANPDGTGILANGSTMASAGNITVYAVWEVNSYKITLKPQGGTCEKESITVKYDDKFGELPECTKKGYSFTGWFTLARGGVEITKDTVNQTDNDRSLYAQYVANKYTYTFDGNGGKVSKDSGEYTYNTRYAELPVAEREGYLFLGYSDTKEGTLLIDEDSIVLFDSNITLYAIWEQIAPATPDNGGTGNNSGSTGNGTGNDSTGSTGNNNTETGQNTGSSQSTGSDTGKSTDGTAAGTTAKAKISVVNAKGKKIKVSFANVTAAKYQVQISKSKKFAKAKKYRTKKYTVKIKNGKGSKTVSKLTKKKTYYVRIRTVSKNGKKTVYGKWSNTVKVKIKK